MRIVKSAVPAGTICLWLLLLALAPAAPPAWAGAVVSVNPERTVVEAGEVFTVSIYKDSADITFDGYEAVVTYDPAVIRYVGAEEGSVMVDPCWNRWWLVTPDSGSIFMSHAMMCGGTTTQGPGALSALTFQALSEGSTAVSVDYFWFTLSGIWIKDVDWHDGIVDVGDLSGVARGTEDGELTLSVKVWPNPAGSFDISVQGTSPAGTVSTLPPPRIYDSRGRAVACPRLKASGAGRHTYEWDGTGLDGRRLAGGVYFVRVAGPGQAVCRRIILLR